MSDFIYEVSHLKIAMLGHKRIPSREGGIEIVVEELATRMAALGHEVTCYNRSGHHISDLQFDGKKMATYKGVMIKSVPTVDIKGLAAFSSSVFASFRVTFGRYDIVHYHAEGPCAMLWLPKLLGKRCVATIHGLDWQREKWKSGFAAKYIKLGERTAVKHADAIIVLSRAMQAYFQQTYGRETIFIPNGITRPQCLPPDEIKQKYKLAGRDYILFLGRLVPEKGLRYLITAYKELNTSLSLVIAGGGSDTVEFISELKVMAGNDHRIIFTGFIQGTMLEELFSNAAIYVLPSDLEGMPLSLLEAMSYGNCCVISDIPECTEVVNNKAVVFNKGDHEDLAKKLQSLIDNPVAAEGFRREASDYIIERYNWDQIVSSTIALYHNKPIGASNEDIDCE